MKVRIDTLIWATVVLVVLFVGSPDLLDAVISRLMKP